MTSDQDLRLKLRESLATIRRLKDEVARLKAARAEKIAIIGAGCRFPGGVRSPEEFWKLLVERRDAISEVPPERWSARAYFDANPVTAGKTNSIHGGFLSDVDQFDAAFFNISSREARRLDPQQRLTLEVAWEAIERSGIDPLSLAGSATGVFIGICSHDYADLQFRELDRIDAYASTGSAASTCAGRLAFLLGLRGPSLAIDTACSSSLVSVHLACQTLRAGECDLALAGGVNLILTPAAAISFGNARMLAPDGRCKTFDGRADGFVRSEGCGIVVLKRLSDALADADPIMAVICGSAVNQDGKSSGLTVPNGPSQEAVIRSALEQAGIGASEISYIEAHGTGTALGDPIEMHALREVFAVRESRTTPLRIGAVKTNLGHLEAAAGIAGLIKAALCLQHRAIPPNLHFHSLNPQIHVDGSGLAIEVSGGPWSADGGRRIAGVSSFGFSGTNAHTVIEEAPGAPEAGAEAIDGHLLVLSAKSEGALTDLAASYRDALNNRTDVESVCRTTQTGRMHFEHRLAVVGGARDEFVRGLGRRVDERRAGASAPHKLAAGPPRIAFLFTGEGRRYVGVGRELYDTVPVFRQTIDRCDAFVRTALNMELLPALFPVSGSLAAGARRETREWLNQVLIFAVQMGLAATWRAWGITPTAVLGHSAGEFGAACFAGVFNIEDGLRLVTEQSRLMDETEPGGMVAAFASLDDMRSIIQECAQPVSLAAINGPRQIVVSGSRKASDEIVGKMKVRGIRHQRLDTTRGFHSTTMTPVVDRFRAVTRAVPYQNPSIDYFSTVTGRQERARVATPEYWVEQMIAPADFLSAMHALHAVGCEAYLEIGSEPILLALGMECVAPTETALWVPSLRSRRSSRRQMLESLGRLYVAGIDPAWDQLCAGRRVTRVTLPTYPFQRRRFWFDDDARSDRSANATPQAAEAARANGPATGTAGSGVAAESSTPRGELVERLRHTPADDRRRVLIAELRAGCARVLDGREGALPDPGVPFFDLGMDSLMAAELIDGLERQLEMSLSNSIAFNYPTINDLATYLLAQIFNTPEDGGSPRELPVSGTRVDPPAFAAGAEDDIAARLAARLETIRQRALLGEAGR